MVTKDQHRWRRTASPSTTSSRREPCPGPSVHGMTWPKLEHEGRSVSRLLTEALCPPRARQLSHLNHVVAPSPEVRSSATTHLDLGVPDTSATTAATATQQERESGPSIRRRCSRMSGAPSGAERGNVNRLQGRPTASVAAPQQHREPQRAIGGGPNCIRPESPPAAAGHRKAAVVCQGTLEGMQHNQRGRECSPPVLRGWDNQIGDGALASGEGWG